MICFVETQTAYQQAPDTPAMSHLEVQPIQLLNCLGVETHASQNQRDFPLYYKVLICLFTVPTIVVYTHGRSDRKQES